jgi:cytidylate kinase
MKKDLLFEYIHQGIETPTKKLPFITISRDYGCPGQQFAQALVDELNKKVDNNQPGWNKIDKEIISLAAGELNLDPELVQRLISQEDQGFFYDLMTSFSNSYVPADIQAKKKVAAIIRSLANKGHMVLLGRGGVILTRNMQQGMHIRLMAGKDWRTDKVMAMHDCSRSDASSMMQTVDRERIYLRSFFAGEEPETSHYDLILNAEKLSVNAMVNSALAAF